MNKLLRILRGLTPFGLVDRRRRNLKLKSLGLSPTPDLYHAVEYSSFELWPSDLRSTDTGWSLIDIGANSGDFIHAVSNLTRLDTVYAFEPQPSCQESLKKILSSIPNAHLHQVAVGSHSGSTEFNCTVNSRMSSVLVPDKNVTQFYGTQNFEIQQTVTVPIVAIDEVVPNDLQVSMMKIDVQGFEIPVIEGAENTLKRTHSLLLEMNFVPHYDGGSDFDDVYKAVSARGFRLAGISPPYMGLNGPLWADALFVRCI